MTKLLFDEAKIKIYSHIQQSLCNLYKNPTDANIDKLINQIPPIFFDQKEDLMVICELFAVFGRVHPISNKKYVFKLFNKIMIHIKKHLPDESSFFWKIFGGNLYFKLWFYEEGLISIEQIVSSASFDNSKIITEIFLPEIIEKVPEIFDKELKYNYQLPYSEEYVKEFKVKRSLHMKWIRESCNFNDQIYSQIETDQLRLCIKRDDIGNFEKVLRESQLTVNSKVKDISFENSFLVPTELSILDFTICCQSHKILKYLIEKKAELSNYTAFNAIASHDVEIINLVRSIDVDFKNKVIDLSVMTWSYDVFECILNNNNSYEVIDRLTLDQFNEIVNLIDKSFSMSNFVFFEKLLLPYFQKNPLFVSNYIYDLLFKSFHQMSCFFTRELLKYKDIIDINYMYVNDDGDLYSLFSQTIDNENSEAIQIVLSYPNVNINEPAFIHYPVFFLACRKNIDLRSIDLLCSYPGFNINEKDKKTNISAFDLAFSNGNFYVTNYVLNKFPDVEMLSLAAVLYNTVQKHHLYTAKIALKHFLKKDENLKVAKIIKEIKNSFSDEDDYAEETIEDIRKIADELGYPCPKPEEEEEEEDSDDNDDSDDPTLNGLALLLGLLMGGNR